MSSAVLLDEFLQLYMRICRDHHIETQECIINQIKTARQKPTGPGVILQLSTHSITSKSCAVLAKLLTTDRAFCDIKLSDCMLPEDGVKALAHGLSHNVACRMLDLKGNNIRGVAVEGLGRMLRQNKNITSLCLEWNSLGLLETSFAVFCEGLGSNGTLHTLDLRNNQLSHDAGIELAHALKRNTTLRVLDLRWNNLGLLGGRGLLECLEHNKTLTRIELTGNNTPSDVIRAIESSVNHNAQKVALNEEYLQRTDILTKELHNVTEERNVQVIDLLDKVDRQDAQIRTSHHKSSARIKQLQSALNDRRSQFNDMNMKVSLAESELALSETKVTDLSLILKRTKEDHEKLMKQSQQELKHAREDKSIMEAKLNKLIIEANDKRIQTENKLDETERRAASQQDQMFELKEKIIQLQADVKLKTTQHEELMHIEKQKTKDHYKEAEEMKRKEIDRARKEIDELESIWKERVNKQEQLRSDLEEEVNKMRAAIVAEKLHSEETIQASKQRIKGEEEQRYRQLEEKYRVAQTCRDELTSQVNMLTTNVNELQMKNTNLVLEAESYKRRVEELNQELCGKNNEMLAEVGKVKIEMSQRVKKLEQERCGQSDLYDKITKLEQELADLSAKYHHTIESKGEEIARLNEKIRTQDNAIAHMNTEETQRVSALQNALQTYINRPTFSPR